MPLPRMPRQVCPPRPPVRRAKQMMGLDQVHQSRTAPKHRWVSEEAAATARLYWVACAPSRGMSRAGSATREYVFRSHGVQVAVRSAEASTQGRRFAERAEVPVLRRAGARRGGSMHVTSERGNTSISRYNHIVEMSATKKKLTPDAATRRSDGTPLIRGRWGQYSHAPPCCALTIRRTNICG